MLTTNDYMLLPSNWILVLAALTHTRLNEPCFFFFLCFIQILNTCWISTQTLTHTHTFFPYSKEIGFQKWIQPLQEVVTKII